MKPPFTQKPAFDFGVLHHRKWGVWLEPGNSMLSPGPYASARRNGVGAAQPCCAASISHFVRLAANFLKVFAGTLGGFGRSMAAGWGFGFDPPLFNPN
jgi:hypothetical protein